MGEPAEEWLGADLRVLPGFSERIRRPGADAGRHDHDLLAPRMIALGTGEQRRTL